MKEFEKQFIIKNISELFAYEIYYCYKNDESSIYNLESIYNALSSHLVFDQYKDEIFQLGKVIAKTVYQVPLQ